MYFWLHHIANCAEKIVSACLCAGSVTGPPQCCYEARACPFMFQERASKQFSLLWPVDVRERPDKAVLTAEEEL